jgi:hypothetical protein
LSQLDANHISVEYLVPQLGSREIKLGVECTVYMKPLIRVSNAECMAYLKPCRRVTIISTTLELGQCLFLEEKSYPREFK